MRRIFTTRFFRLSPADQCAVVTAHIHDMEECLGRYGDPTQDKLARQRLARFKARAKKLGIVGEDPLSCKAWRFVCGNGAMIVTARTKKRAMALIKGDCPQCFHLEQCDGDWWHHLAHEEAVWVEEQDNEGHRNGAFHRTLAPVELERILESHVLRYWEMSRAELLGQVGRASISGVSQNGVPYTITTVVERNDRERVCVQSELKAPGWRKPAAAYAVRYWREGASEVVTTSDLSVQKN